MANNLRSLRLSRGWSQDEAATALGTTRSQYVKLEHGARRLTEKWIGRAAEAFGIDDGDVVRNAACKTPAIEVIGEVGIDGRIKIAGLPQPSHALALGRSLGVMLDDWYMIVAEEQVPTVNVLQIIGSEGGDCWLGRLVHAPLSLVQRVDGALATIAVARAWRIGGIVPGIGDLNLPDGFIQR